jgi:hypothetical protein
MPDLSALTLEAALDLVRQLLEANGELQAKVLTLEQQNADLQREIAGLRSPPGGGAGATAKPDWVKANRPPRPPDKEKRKKREQAFVRLKQPPTRVEVHAVERCPDCDRKLEGGWVHRTREVIEIPAVPVEIIEHVLLARRCGVCAKRHVPRLDLSSVVVGKHRVGVRLMSFIGWLHEIGRMPIRRIQSLLMVLYGLHLSAGEICEVLHTLAKKGEPAYGDLQKAVQAHPFVHADETGWREDGVNGYLWSFSTPTVRFFVHDKSRSHEVPERVLGADWKGILCSDFYSGYYYHPGLHQRCWVHFSRDLKALKEKHPDDLGVSRWVDGVLDIYHRAKHYQNGDPRQRVKAREQYQSELAGLAEPYARSDCPQRVLAERAVRFLPELFTFVEHPDVPPDNNAAERAIRPSVIARKVSGGTRSDAGSKTRSVLMSLYATWQAQGRNVLAACQAMLAGKPQPAAGDA